MSNNHLVNLEIARCYAKGKRDELWVAELLTETCGGTWEEATRMEDRNEHIDFWWQSPRGGKLGIDVKGKRRHKRGDIESDGSIHWIEYINVQGDMGWAFGLMDYIAFITDTSILFVKPSKIQTYLIPLISGKETVYETPDEFYIPYQRRSWNREDVIFKVPTSDLIKIAHFKIDYLPIYEEENIING